MLLSANAEFWQCSDVDDHAHLQQAVLGDVEGACHGAAVAAQEVVQVLQHQAHPDVEARLGHCCGAPQDIHQLQLGVNRLQIGAAIRVTTSKQWSCVGLET